MTTESAAILAAAIPDGKLSFFSLISLLITLTAVSSYINYRYIKLPTTIGVMLVALVASLALIIAGPYAEGFANVQPQQSHR